MARSMPAAAPWRPRYTLPPPTTTATWTPRALTPAIARAMAAMRAGSAPYDRSPISASPESFSRIRLNAGSGAGSVRSLLPDLEAREAPHDDVLAGVGRQLGAQLLERLAAVKVVVDVALAEQHDLLEPLPQAALDDLLLDGLGLALGGGLLTQHAQLGLLVLLGHVLLGDVERVGGSDVQRHLPRELLELVGAGHEVGLAVDLDQHSDLAAGVDVAGHHALRGGAAAALGGRCLPLHAQDLDRLVHVALRLLQGGLGVHDAGARALAQGLDVLCRNSGAQLRAPLGIVVGVERAALARRSGAAGRLGPGAARCGGLVGREACLLRLAAGAVLGLLALTLLLLALSGLLGLAALLLLALAPGGLLLGAKARRALAHHVRDRLDHDPA